MSVIHNAGYYRGRCRSDTEVVRTSSLDFLAVERCSLLNTILDVDFLADLYEQ